MNRTILPPARIAIAALLICSIVLASCSPTRVHKHPPRKKGDGFVGKILHRKEMSCGC